MYIYSYISLTIVNTAPLLKDLYQHITPQYAADWVVIGTLLDIPVEHLTSLSMTTCTELRDVVMPC